MVPRALISPAVASVAAAIAYANAPNAHFASRLRRKINKAKAKPKAIHTWRIKIKVKVNHCSCLA